MKIQSMESPRTGKAVANQVIVDTMFMKAFYSYGTCIVESRDGKIYLDETYWNYSKTTSKYRSQFLGETTKETQAKIDSGEYVLTNLN